MKPPKCNDLDYIHFLISSPRTFTRTEAARYYPESKKPLPDGKMIIRDAIRAYTAHPICELIPTA